jgi:hypothetical protein
LNNYALYSGRKDYLLKFLIFNDLTVLNILTVNVDKRNRYLYKNYSKGYKKALEGALGL